MYKRQVVGYADKTATYASAKEFFESGGIKHCVLPIITNVEAEEEKSLLLDGEGLQIKHNLDVLLRANTKDRYEALFKAIGRPFMTGNEGRAIEDLNPDPDPSMDKVLLPVNMATSEPEPEPPPPPGPARPMAPPPEDDEEPEAARLQLLRQYAHDNAARVVRREQAWVKAEAPKCARDKAGWRAAVLERYGKHARHVAEVMRVPEEDAKAYCDGQAAALLAGGAGVVEGWEAECVPRLVSMALGE